MDEKSNKREEDKLVNFPSLLSLESSTCVELARSSILLLFQNHGPASTKWWDPYFRIF
jgi:hypothetical protein